MSNANLNIKDFNKIFFPRDLPIVFSSPHSGNNYSKELLDMSPLILRELRRNEDMFVGDLFNFSDSLGVGLLKAEFPRVFLDLNRCRKDIDIRMLKDNYLPFKPNNSKYSKFGFGLIPKISSNGKKIYNKKLMWSVLDERIKKNYDPWHKTLLSLCSHLIKSNISSVLLDCHSMPSDAVKELKKNIPDIIIGDNFGKSCNLEIVNYFIDALRDEGFAVARNNIFSGGYITSHYGNLSSNLNVLQIEIRRDLYMNEDKLIKNNNYMRLKSSLEKVIERLIQFLVVINSNAKAAE